MPANQLKGLTLENGWTVVDKVSNPNGTGGHFSVCYEVINEHGDKAFLKALDYSRALRSNNPARELEYLTSLFNFERDVLEKCKGHKLSRVVVPLESGKIAVTTSGPQTNVEYIIFQKALGDLRNSELENKIIDTAWSLRALHQAAVGLQQLHSKRIIHQDIKPSNVLYFEDTGMKVSDLGTSFDPGTRSPSEKFAIAGAVEYAPLDRRYSQNTPSHKERVATDIYLLGSLFFFFFCGISASQAICTKLKSLGLENSLSCTDFEKDLPFIERAFNDAITDLTDNIRNRIPEISNEIREIATSMCHPDPRRRGIPSQIKSGGNQFDMHRYVSKLDLVAMKAELRIA